jgi:hypothetical protein
MLAAPASAMRPAVKRAVKMVNSAWAGTYGGFVVGQDGQGLLRSLKPQVRRLLACRAASPNPDGRLEHTLLHTATRRPQHDGGTPWSVPAGLRVGLLSGVMRAPSLTHAPCHTVQVGVTAVHGHPEEAMSDLFESFRFSKPASPSGPPNPQTQSAPTLTTARGSVRAAACGSAQPAAMTPAKQRGSPPVIETEEKGRRGEDEAEASTTGPTSLPPSPVAPAVTGGDEGARHWEPRALARSDAAGAVSV